MEHDCPICLESLQGSIATIGCCKQSMHLECLVKCMKQNLHCPLCRSLHESLRMVQDVESQVLVPVSLEIRNKNFFRNMFMGTVVGTILVLSFEKYY
jgi:hypothetical protein